MKYLFLSFSLVFFACGSGNSELSDLGYAAEEIQAMKSMPVTEQPAPPTRATNEQFTRKVIKNGRIEFQSESIEEEYSRIKSLLPGLDAYIQRENQYKSTERIYYNLMLRVPAENYDSLMEVLSNLAYRLDNKSSNIDDVTDRYYDLKTRIKNKKALESRYLEILEQAKAIKDILEIERNLNEVRTEIERLQGQFNYLSKQVSLSTLDVSFYEVLPYVYDDTSRQGFGARILSAMNRGWQGFLSFTVGVISLWPFLIIIGGVIYLFRRFKIQWRRKKN